MDDGAWVVMQIDSPDEKYGRTYNYAHEPRVIGKMIRNHEAEQH
jgi:hypothetical protein